MPAKIRLQRQGRKFQAIYSIVVADSRAPRDGKFIEELGQYNPNINPATIVLDFNKALVWLQNGAQPTDTCRAILSYKGVLYKKHLLDGVKKGAFDEAEAEKRFQAWMTEKEQKVQGKKDRLKLSKEQLDQSRMEGESKIKEARAAEIAKKRSDLVKKEAAAASGEEVVEEVATEATEGTEAVAEEPAVEEVAKVPAEEPEAEAVEEPSTEEPEAEAA
ncbi:MAG: 30S ribosomal protein S16, partial [Bacteroidia bacterium]